MAAGQLLNIANRYLDSHLHSASTRAMIDVLSADPVPFLLTRLLGSASNFSGSYMVAEALRRPSPQGFSTAEYRTPARWALEGVTLATNASELSLAMAASMPNEAIQAKVTAKLEAVRKLLGDVTKDLEQAVVSEAASSRTEAATTLATEAQSQSVSRAPRVERYVASDRR